MLQTNEVASSGKTGDRLIDAGFVQIAIAAGFELKRE